MTGYGRGVGKSDNRTITVELKSLNSKQLDLQVRMPQTMREFEVELRNMVSAALERGKVEMTVSEELTGKSLGVNFDAEAISNYKQQIEALSAKVGIPEPSDWYAVLLRLPDAMKQSPVQFDDDDSRALMQAASGAIEAICAFRLAEGRKLYNFFKGKINALFGLLAEVDPYEAGR